MSRFNAAGHEWFNYNGDRNQYDLDRNWWWDGNEDRYYDDFGNQFSMELITGMPPSEASAFMRTFPMPGVLESQQVIEYLAQRAKELVA
jgi:hypothetical protein